MTTSVTPLISASTRLGRGVPVDWNWASWERPDRLVSSSVGFDVEWEQASLRLAADTSSGLLSVRFTPNEVLIGPLWTQGSACAGCAHAASGYLRWESAQRPERDRAERERDRRPVPGTYAGSGFPGWLEETVGVLVRGDWEPGQLIAVTAKGQIAVHHVNRTFRCGVCAQPARALLVDASTSRPEPLRLERRAATAAVPTRSGTPYGLDPDRMRAALGDTRFGPVVRMTRNVAGAFAMSEVELLAGTPSGVGRGRTFADAEAIGVLEAFERLGGYPHAAPVVVGMSKAELGELALDPARLGGYTDEQYASPTSKIARYHDSAPLDWVWARPLGGSDPVLVPAEVGFYRYGYGIRDAQRRGYFLDSSSGSALGSNLEEAALHSLLELAERDAFLQAWHRAEPLASINHSSLDDPDSVMLLRLADERGYDVHLLVATADLSVPVVWALAINRTGALPASFSAAGCHPDPRQAVRAALWELDQMVVAGLAWDPEPLRASIDDPWLVEDIPGHWRRYAFPELLPRVQRVLGGPALDMREAFPQWPTQLVRAAKGSVTGALMYVADLFRAAGLPDILVVDQSTVDHAAMGLCVAKCVVPGIVPMCFGHAHQRLVGLPRLYADGVLDPAGAPFDPHPFP